MSFFACKILVSYGHFYRFIIMFVSSGDWLLPKILLLWVDIMLLSWKNTGIMEVTRQH